MIVEIINQSYSDLSVNYEQIISYTKTKVYDSDLWILIYEIKSRDIVGCGIADFDGESKEGILEWIQVLPEYRGKKVGQLIVNELLHRMKRANFAAASGKLDSLSNPERLYRKCGFVGNDIWHILLMSIAMKPLCRPPFPIERIEEMTELIGGDGGMKKDKI